MQIIYLTKQLDPYTTQPFFDWVEECMSSIPNHMRDVVTMGIRLEEGMGDSEPIQLAEWSYDARGIVPIHKLEALLKAHPKFATMVVQLATLSPSGKGEKTLFFTGEHHCINDESYDNHEQAYPPLIKWLKSKGWVYVRDIHNSAPYLQPFIPSSIK
jgi:hypothetical protein